MRHPRQKDEAHLRFIRQLPCIVCLDNTSTEAAHIRGRDLRAGKPESGMGQKPHDAFTLPLCSRCHRLQHAMSEIAFWLGTNVRDPIRVALALWVWSGDVARGEEIIMANQ